MRRAKLAGVVGTLAVAALLGGAAPASAAPSGDLQFWETAFFTGRSATYPAAKVTQACTTLEFTVHAQLNQTDKAIEIFATPDCTGHALYFPANDIHSFIGFDGKSFRAAKG
ncbi:hypothetical protein JOF53_005535 [Crossiella equi]|uniref:Uncharacterized protein n=1 Tax=Crossiella equi TaxID=130796 RepID=A0ABS5AJB1_9PSEU|nr:hypothetical protein [Crossiella equi]MBP2476663.1 hypothetical protein [Crossiella equi]